MSGWRGVAVGLAGRARLRWHRSPSCSSRGAITSASSWWTSPAAWRRSPRWPSSARSGSRAITGRCSGGSADVDRASALRQRRPPQRRALRASTLAPGHRPWCERGCPGCSSASRSSSGGSRRSSATLNQGALAPTWDVPMLHRAVFRDYPVVPQPVDPARIDDPAYRQERAEVAMFTVNWASATGTGDPAARRSPARSTSACRCGNSSRSRSMTLRRMRGSLLTIMLMLALGFVTRYGGTDATLGLAFTKTGWFYPFFATLLGWLGVALTGIDTQLQRALRQPAEDHRQQLGFNPILIVTANSTGGVMGKMIDAQSIVVADGVDRPGRAGRADPAVRLLAQRRAGGDHGRDRHGCRRTSSRGWCRGGTAPSDRARGPALVSRDDPRPRDRLSAVHPGARPDRSRNDAPDPARARRGEDDGDRGPVLRRLGSAAAPGRGSCGRGRPVQATLTDLFPNVPAFQKIADASGGLIEFEREPVDARHVPVRLQGLRTIFNGFHHLARRRALHSSRRRRGAAADRHLRSVRAFAADASRPPDADLRLDRRPRSCGRSRSGDSSGPIASDGAAHVPVGRHRVRSCAPIRWPSFARCAKAPRR